MHVTLVFCQRWFSVLPEMAAVAKGRAKGVFDDLISRFHQLWGFAL
jgi:hypothetical protein